MRSLRVAAVVCVGVAGSAATAWADEVTDWNTRLLNAIAAENVAPPVATRMMAMVHVAQADAVSSITRGFAPYSGWLPAPAGTSARAAASASAHRVMSGLFPQYQSTFDAQLNAHLAAIPGGLGVAEGVALGRACADVLTGARAGDGWNNGFVYNGGTAVGQWRPTPPGNLPAALPHWRHVTPWVVQDRTQFRPGPPPAVGGAQYAAAYNQVRELGALNSPTRTPEQTDIAFLWRAGPNTVTPPGQWNQIAQQASAARNLNLEQNARLFGLLGLAVADAGITAWEAKNHYDLWRPITGIRLGEDDGNPATAGDPTWEPLFATPNHQSYTSGHSTFSASAAAILAAFFGGDAMSFTVTGDGRTRAYTSFSAAAAEAGMSRIYGGIHWAFDNTAGLSSGRLVGEWVYANALAIPTPATGAALALAGAIAIGRRRRVSP